MKSFFAGHAIAACTPIFLTGLALSCSSNTTTAVPSGSPCTDCTAASPRAVRLFLTPSLTARLKARAGAKDYLWALLARTCDDFARGTVFPPDANPSEVGFPDVVAGYQGEGYIPPLMSLGLCYRVALGNDATAAQTYGAAGERLLLAMSTPVNAGGQSPSADSGYGIRNYGAGMAIGFDWLYPALSAATRKSVTSALEGWIDWYDVAGLGRDQPIGNYFAGYLLAKTATALATDGEDAKASGYFDEVRTMWEKPTFARSMKGGGWPEGWVYGAHAVRNVVETLWAVKTAKNLDWIADVPQARDQAEYLSYFAWPSLERMNDDGTIRSGAHPTPSAALANSLATILGEIGDPAASKARTFAAAITAVSDDRVPWEKFLYSDSSSPTSPYQERELSYVAPGPGHVAMRSSWGTDAVWAALSSGTYISAPDSAEQMFNQGSVSIVVGNTPLIVNPTGWIPQEGGTAGENFVYDDTWGKKSRTLYNTFFVSDPSNPFNPGQAGMTPDEAQTHVERYEEWGGFVRARAANVEQMYRSDAVGEFTRDLVFLRPDTFVLADRTRVTAERDQWMAFHTATVPKAVRTADATSSRFDVSQVGGANGSIRMLLPQVKVVKSVNLPGGVTRLEEHADAALSQRWLTVISASAQVPEQVRLSSADGNVTAGNLVGVHLQGPRNRVLLFANEPAATDAESTARYTVTQTADADHVLIDAGPSSNGYAVDVKAVSGSLAVEVKPNGSFEPTPGGALCFSVSMSGAVGPCAFGPTGSVAP